MAKKQRRDTYGRFMGTAGRTKAADDFKKQVKRSMMGVTPFSLLRENFRSGYNATLSRGRKGPVYALPERHDLGRIAMNAGRDRALKVIASRNLTSGGNAGIGNAKVHKVGR